MERSSHQEVLRLGLVLLSGGLDSTTVATLAKSEGFDLAALTLRYGQSHQKELDSAAKVAHHLGLKQTALDVDFYGDLAWYSALTRSSTFTLPAARSIEDMPSSVPITYVPLRNTFFLTLGAALLESQALHWIEVERVPPDVLEVSLFIAANAVDYSGYPDCRPEYYDVLSETLARGSKLGSHYGVKFNIETPIISKSKAEIVRLGLEIGAPLHLTWSCYRGADRPCGVCDSCILRAKGFQEAGVPDPAVQR